MLEAGLTLVPALLHETLPTLPLIAQVVALAIPVHDNVEDCPAVIVVGLAVNDPIVGTAVTLTVVVTVALPPAPVAVIVYVVVDAGLTVVLALLHPTLPTPLLIEQVDALVIPLHDNVEDCPAVIKAGLAANDPKYGAAVTVMVAVAVALPPAAPVDVSV